MIALSLSILSWTGIGIFIIYFGSEVINVANHQVPQYGLDGKTKTNHRYIDKDFSAIGCTFIFQIITPVLIVLGMNIYFLVMIRKFFKEPIIMSGQEAEMPYNSIQGVVPGGGVSNMYLSPAIQNVTGAQQQQPVINYVPTARTVSKNIDQKTTI